MSTKKTLFILRNSPYGSAMAQEGLDAVLAASVFDQEISVLFMDEGVWNLQNHQQEHKEVSSVTEIKNSERKNIAAQIESFPLYDIDNVFVDEQALAHFSLLKSELIIQPKTVSENDIRQLIDFHDVVLNY